MANKIIYVFKSILKPRKRYEAIANLSLTLFILFFIGFYMATEGRTNLLSGDFPPKAPIIKELGVFSAEQDFIGGHQVRYVQFFTDNGETYMIADHTWPHELYDFAKLNPGRKVYAEGFLLQNGRGSYFPLLIKGVDGKTLIGKDVLSSAYDRMKSAGNDAMDVIIKASIFYGFFFLFLFIKIYRSEEN